MLEKYSSVFSENRGGTWGVIESIGIYKTPPKCVVYKAFGLLEGSRDALTIARDALTIACGGPAMSRDCLRWACGFHYYFLAALKAQTPFVLSLYWSAALLGEVYTATSTSLISPHFL